MIFIIAAGLILIYTAVAFWAAPPLEKCSGRICATAACVAGAMVAGVGLVAGPAPVLDAAAAIMLAIVAAGLARQLFLPGRWPGHGLLLALTVITATGSYLRADRLQAVVSSPDPRLQADVQYYQQQALKTANPFAAGIKSPLWPALNAPLVRLSSDRDTAMRILSWTFGILMLPLVGLALARLFDPIVGVVVAATLAVEPWLIDLCTQGLREEFSVCLWMVTLAAMFPRVLSDSPWQKGTGTSRDRVLDNASSVRLGASPLLPGAPEAMEGTSWRRVIVVGLLAGMLLLLRNLNILPVLALILLAVVQQKWGWRKALVGVAVPLLIVSPFYINQWRTYGDPLAMEKRDARYHANLEFSRATPAGLSMPSPEALDSDLYAGEPLSPLAYLLHWHRPSEFLQNQWHGMSRIVVGQPFEQFAGLWLRLACAAGVLATVFVGARRFAVVFLITSTAGMVAHLAAIGSIEVRLLLPVFIVWLACGWWLVAALARRGLEQWSRQVPPHLHA